MTSHPPPRRDEDVDAELAFHVEMQTRRYVDAGLDPASARVKALERLGNLEETRRSCRAIVTAQEQEMTRTAWFNGLGQDVSYARRVLRRAPLFTITALLTIAVGIGATTAIVSVLKSAMFDAVPYPDASRLHVIWNEYATLSHAAVSAGEFADITERNRAFEAVAAIRPTPGNLTGTCGSSADCEPERVNAYQTSPNLFEVLRAAPAIGRGFTAGDGITGAPGVVILSDALWRRRFGADPGIVGKTITFAALPRTVVGVMPAWARFPDAPVGYLRMPAELWVPFDHVQNRNNGRGNQNLAVIGRARAGVSAAQVQADLDRISGTFRTDLPDRYAGAAQKWRLEALTLRDQVAGDAKPVLLMLLGAVSLLLLIACANVANLVLARGTARSLEMAVRSALGAGRQRLIRQLFVETALVVAVGGVLGIGLAVALLRALVSLDPGSLPGLDSASIDGVVLLGSVAMTMATGLLIGLVPALRASRAHPQAALGAQTRGAAAAPARRRVRHALVVVEVTMAVVVLVAAGLVVRSLARLTQVPSGFDAGATVSAQITLPRATYNSADKVYAFQRDFTARLRALPGVTSASAVYPLPMSGEGWSGTLGIEGFQEAPGIPEPHAEFAVALPGYFATMGIIMREGRDFADSDTAAMPPVVVVDDVLAKQYFPNESAIGKRVNFGGPITDGKTPWSTVIGVVDHVRNRGPRTAGEGQYYMAALQKSEFTLFFVTRPASADTPVAPAIRNAVRDIDPRLPIARLEPIDAVVTRATARERFAVLLLAGFGLVALVLAGIGLYGVMSYLVGERTREIGVRLALGGRPRHVLARVLGEGIVLTLFGLAFGLGIAYLLSETVSTLLFNVTPTDPLTYAAIAGLVLAVATVAAFLPARRATRVDPLSVLRS